jgi:hypothetical protein
VVLAERWRITHGKTGHQSLLTSLPAASQSYLLGSICGVIEVKSHRFESAEIRAGALLVTYNGKEKNVTKQKPRSDALTL